MKKTKLLIAAIMASGLVGTGIVQAQNRTTDSAATKSTLSHGDKKFIEHAAESGMAEVEMAKLGEQKAQNAQVKQFAQTLQQDHQQANQQLMQIAQQKGVDIKEKNTHKDNRTMEHLEKASGAEFDRMFVQDMIKDHQKDIKEFEKEANKGEDPEVKAFAQQTLPKLREHLQTAESLASTVGAKVNEPAGAKTKQKQQQ